MITIDGYVQWFPQLQQNIGMDVLFGSNGYSQSSQ
jgi:hypothetical protein